MALWLLRGGSQGEYETKFLDEKRAFLTWDGLKDDLSQISDRVSLRNLLEETYPECSKHQIGNFLGQVRSFSKSMQIDDLIAMPRKGKSIIVFGKIRGEYEHHPEAENPFYHSREIEWFDEEGMLRSKIDQDLLYSLGASQTICQITKNDAERRIRTIVSERPDSHSHYQPATQQEERAADAEEEQESVDFAALARDQIAKEIIKKFKGHGMTRLVEAILKAQGYTTFKSPEGPDKGIDILAAPGQLGFAQPRICVQVKSSDSPIGHQTLNELIGVMQNVAADQGLLVSWGGFRSSVEKETAQHFFKVRLWDQDTILDQLFSSYEKLDENIRAELPLKRFWSLAEPQE